MKEDERDEVQKTHAKTINTLINNQQILIERIDKLEGRDTAIDTELAVNKAVDKIVSSVQQQTTPVTTPTEPKAVAPTEPAPAEPTPTETPEPEPKEPVTEPKE